MADANLLLLERAALASEDPHDEATLLRELIRLGHPLGALRVAALCGDAEAQRQVDLLPELLATTVQVANVFAVSAVTVGSWCRDGCPHEGRSTRRRFDLARVHAWRVDNGWSWTRQHALESWVALVVRWVGTEPARWALTRTVALLEGRWREVLSPAAASAAEMLLAVCSPERPALEQVAASRAALEAELPPRLSWDSDIYKAVLPLRLLSDACRDPKDATLLARLARSVVPGLTTGPDQGTALARKALDVCRFALDPWCQRQLAP